MASAADEKTALLGTTTSGGGDFGAVVINNTESSSHVASEAQIPATGTPRKRTQSTSLTKAETQKALCRWIVGILVVSILATVVILLVTFGFKRNPTRNQGCIFDYDPNINYFPDRVSPMYAGFTTAYTNNYKLYNNSYNQDVAVITQCGTTVPDFVVDDTKNYSSPIVFAANENPVVVNFLELHGLSLSLLFQENLLNADGLPTIVSPCIQFLYVDGYMEPLPPLTQPVDRYRRLDEVDVLFGDSELTFEGGKAISIGIDDESDPLAAAEWMKFVLGFYNYEREVTATFDGIKDRYECWERKVVAATDIANPTPLIRQNVAFVAYDEETGVWTASVVPRIVNLVGAAGGAIAFNDVTFYNDTELYNALASNSIDVFFETGSSVKSIPDLLRVYGLIFDNSMPFYENFRVYRLDNYTSAAGTNDWDQRAVAQPDAALQDLIAVLHPSLALPGYWRRWIWNMYTEHPFVGGNNNGAGVTEYDCASRTMADFERPSPVLGQSCE